MAADLQFFDMSIVVTPPNGHKEPLPITLGPNWQPNDYRLVFASGSGSEQQTGVGVTATEMVMTSDPPAAFTTAYALNAGKETHGVYYRQLVTGDNDQFVTWKKPSKWRHFMFGLLTARGVSPGGTVTAGTLSGWRSGANGVSYTIADTTTSATVNSVTVPGAGTMVFFLGNVSAPTSTQWPQWPVAMGCPTGWTNLVATPNSGDTYFQYDVNPSAVVVAKTYASAGSTGSVVFPAGQGSPAFVGLYVFLAHAPDVSVTVGAA
jgi:hypothetical protein